MDRINFNPIKLIRPGLFCTMIFVIALEGTLGSLIAGNIKMDYLAFRSKRPPQAYVEVYFSVSNSMLQFNKGANDKYEANIEILLDAKGGPQDNIYSEKLEKKIVTSYYHATRDEEVNNIFKFPLWLMPGKYTTIITVHDKNNKHTYSVDLPMEVPDFWQDLSVSSIKISRIKGETTTFNPEPVFGFLNPRAEIYFETYNIQSDLLRTEVAILTLQDSLVRRIAQPVRVNRKNLSFSMPLSLGDLAMGTYKLRITQSNPDDGTRASNEKLVFILQSPVDLHFKDYQTAVEEIRYLLTEEQYEKMLRVPTEQQQQVLLDFWKKKDPTPDTEENEAMNEYYVRLYEANRFFSNSSVPGWKTDFGFIYLLFGRPDEILRYYRRDRFEERHVWRYKKLNLSFTFINWYNYNMYTLLDKKNIAARYVPNY